MAERIWEKYLTEQDKENLRRREAKPKLAIQHPAILLIDLYRWVFGDEPEPVNEAIKTWPGSCGLAAWDSLPHIERLIETGRELDLPIIHVTGLDPAESGIERHAAVLSEADLDPAMKDRRRRQFDIVDQVAPLPGETIVRKTGASAFWSTPLAAHLYSKGIDSLIVAGESTSGCVRASVVEAKAYHFNVVVAEECVFDRHEAAHAMNLFDMNQKYANVISTQDAIELLPSLSLTSSRP
jgi:nicotinamidase-related amidase